MSSIGNGAGCAVGKLLFLGKDEPGCSETLRAQLDVGCGVCAKCLGRIWDSLWFAALPGCQAWSRAGSGPDGLGEMAGNVPRSWERFPAKLVVLGSVP